MWSRRGRSLKKAGQALEQLDDLTEFKIDGTSFGRLFSSIAKLSEQAALHTVIWPQTGSLPPMVDIPTRSKATGTLRQYWVTEKPTARIVT